MAVTVLTADEVTAALAALTARVAALEGATPDPDPDPDPPSAGWPKGGSQNTNLGQALADWARTFGYTPTCGTVYLTRAAGWDGLIASASHTGPGQLAAHTDKSLTMMIQAPPFPDATPWNYADLAAGKYNPNWVRVGQALAAREAAGYKRAVLNGGWEMNGAYMRWGGMPQPAGQTGHYPNPAAFKAGFRQLAISARQGNPGQLIGWCINAHGQPASIGTSDPRDLYPGDDVVDEIGIDAYDMFPPSIGANDAAAAAAFDRQANAVGGLFWLADFAQAHNRPLAIPEWGICANPDNVRGGTGGGDNPVFIRKMREAFAVLWARRLPDGRPLLAREFYFADPMGGGNVDSTLIGANPKAAAEYKRLWAAS